MDYYPQYMKYKMKYLNLKKKLNVGEIKENTKSIVMNGGGNLNEVILFKAEWCPHCKSFESDWNNMQKEFSNKYKFVTVDDSNIELRKEYSSKELSPEGYPTLFLGKEGSYYEYVGEMSKENVLNFVKNFD